MLNDELVLQNNDFDKLLTSTKEEQIIKNLKNYYKSSLNGASHNTTSDVYGGVTNLQIKGSYGHTEPFVDGGNYWYKASGEQRRQPNKECFAGWFSNTMLNGEDSTKLRVGFSDHLPSTDKCLENMVIKMKSEGKS